MLKNRTSFTVPTILIGSLVLAMVLGGNPVASITGTSYVPETVAGDCLGGNTGCDNNCPYIHVSCSGEWSCAFTEQGPLSCPPPPVPPSCADSGQLGTYPNCYTPPPPPPPPTCADSGQVGTYPSCYTPEPPPPAPSCSDYPGHIGTYPNCYTPAEPTCADSGQLGSYPNCYTPAEPTCADSGQQGTYPNCYSGSVSASCTPSPSTAAIGSPVTWTASISGFSGTPTYAWTSSFGTPSSQNSTSNSFTTTYAGNGQYAASVSVTDYSGNAVASCTPVTVGSSCSASADLTVTATPSRLRSGEESTIEYSFTNVPQGTSCTLKENGTVIASPSSSSCNVSSTSLNRTIGAQTTYLLECGAVTEQVTVNVVANIVEF